MKDPLLENNLANVKVDIDLFGTEIKKLSMSERIGFLPLSIWRPDWNIVKRLKGIIGDTGETRELMAKSRNTATYKTSLGNSDNAISIFNPHLAQMILSAYCPREANIYDPFGGGGTRGFIASAMGHSYTGVEIRQNEVDRIKAQQHKLQNEFSIICGDSCIPTTLDHDSFDFSYSCPPYYDLEVYSDLAGDISSWKTYDEFLGGIRVALQNSYDVLKAGSFCVWVVGNFRDKNGCLVHFSGDTVRIAKEVGFKLWDEIIFWGAAGIASSRSGQFEANRKSVRVHENIIILKK
jgi:DNA modification methylase